MIHAASLNANLVSDWSQRAYVDCVNHPVVIIVIIFSRINAAITISILSSHGNTNQAGGACVNQIKNAIVVIVLVFNGVLATVLVMIQRI